MTDKNLKQEDCTLAVKVSRGQTPVSLHQIPQPSANIIPSHGGYSISPADVVHHPHLSYRMLQQPSFQIHHPLTLTAPLSGSNTRPGPISNDLGPPIFMPPLNLGVPKSLSTTSSAPTNKLTQLPPSSSSSTSTAAITTALHPPTHDGTSSPNVVTSYPNLISPSGSHYHMPTTMLHPSQLPVSAQPVTSTTSKTQSISKGSGSTVNFVRKVSQDQDEQGKGVLPVYLAQGGSISVKGVKQSGMGLSVSSATGYPSNNVINQNAGMGMGPGRGANPAVTINLMKPTVSKSTSSSSIVEMPAGTPPGHMTYIAPTGHFQQLPSSNMQNSSKPYTKGTKEPSCETSTNKNKPGVGEATSVTISSGLGGGNVLVCTEGLPPPVPRNTNSTSLSLSTDIKLVERSHSSNHLPELPHSSMQCSAGLSSIKCSDSHIPWPEAVSNNIIIPAPNLTGKDIANLTSAASSPIATNDRIGNDISWLSLSDQHHPLSDNHHFPASAADSASNNSRSGPSSSSSNTNPQDSGYYQTGSGSGSLGLSLLSQNIGSSPRPSILRKRAFDGRPPDSLPSPSSSSPSSGMHQLLRQRSRGSSCESGENHIIRDGLGDISSPRKRPRKQHFDSMNDHHLPTQNLQDGEHPLAPPHASGNSNNLQMMVANERLLGPLPLKEKVCIHPPRPNGEEYLKAAEKQEKSVEVGMAYMSQLRRSPYPMVQLCRRGRRTAHNHFRRHVDIKNKEEQAISPHEVCSQSSTWMRSSGWKLQHFNSQLNQIESFESDVLSVVEKLKEDCDRVLSSMSEEELEEKHRKYLREIILGNIERIRRSRMHSQETKESMMKILDANSKVVDIMKKFASHIPTNVSITSTSVTERESSPS